MSSTNKETPLEEIEDKASLVATKAPRTRKSWMRYVLYALASVGTLVLLFVVIAVVHDRTNHAPVSIDESATIEAIMSRTYGKYSETHKGWLYVGSNNRTYVMHVVQQAKIEDRGSGEELYFVASGTPLNNESGGLYGVFQVRAKDGYKDPKLIETSSEYNYEGDVPLTPERVKFVALSDRVWGWVIKVQEGTNTKKELVRVNNVVLTPNGDEITEVGRFFASVESDPSIDCKEANDRYLAWQNPKANTNTPNADEKPLANPIALQISGEDDESDEPMRCNGAQWKFRMGPVNGQAVVPIYVTRKGIIDGKNLDEKTWKIMFDNKSYIYIVPDELAPVVPDAEYQG